MKKTIMTLLLLVSGMTLALAQTGNTESKPAQIKFDKTSHDFGTVSLSEGGKASYTFIYTNIGEQPLVINQVQSSCGCTIPDWTKEPVQPGEKGQVKVTFNAVGRSNPGHFKRTISVRTNGVVELTRLHIEGDVKE